MIVSIAQSPNTLNVAASEQNLKFCEIYLRDVVATSYTLGVNGSAAVCLSIKDGKTYELSVDAPTADAIKTAMNQIKATV